MSNENEEIDYSPNAETSGSDSSFTEPNYGNYDYSQPTTSTETGSAQIATPAKTTPDKDGGAASKLHDKLSGAEAYRKTLDDKDYYDKQLQKNAGEKDQLEKDAKKTKEDADQKKNALEEKKKNTEANKNKLAEAKKKKPNAGNNQSVADKLKGIKERRGNLKQIKNDLKNSKNEEKKAEDESKKADEKQKEADNNLKKNENERESLLKNKEKAERFKKLHPIKAAKMGIKHALDKLKKVLILKILVPLLLILIGVALIVNLMYEVFEKVDTVFTAAADIQEKFDNFTNGLGFQNSEEAFYDDLKAQQEEYNNQINIPLLLSTLFYDDIQNNMNPSNVGADVVTGEESLVSFGVVFDYVKSKIDESNTTVGPDGYKYSSNKIYRMRMLAKNMTSKSGSTTVSIGAYWDRVKSRIGKAFLNMIDITNIFQIVFQPGDYIESIYQMLTGDEVFETTDFGNFIHDNVITDALDFIGTIFESIFDIESISFEGVTYSSHTYDEEAYFKYLKEEYIPRMPEFKKYILDSEGNVIESAVDNLIEEIKQIYEDYKFYFELPDEDAEAFNDNCKGTIDNVLVSVLQKPINNSVSPFSGNDAYGVSGTGMHNGVTLTHSNSVINKGDPIMAVADGKVVGIGRSSGETSGDASGNTTGVSAQFPKYELNDRQLRGIAKLCQAEQGSVEGAKAEASLIANKYELSGSSKTLYDYVYGNRWWANSAKHLDEADPREEILEAVRDVLINGNRTLPPYVDEHDCIDCNKRTCDNGIRGDICVIKNNNATYTDIFNIKDRNNYKTDETEIHNKYGAIYTFYNFPSSSSDPFGYTKNSYNKAQNRVEAASNWIKIEHEVVAGNKSYKFYTIYKYLETISDGVDVGKYITKGQTIGTVGNVYGNPEASFYFEFRNENDTAINPTNLFIVCSSDAQYVGDSLAEKIWWAMLDAGFSKEAAAGVIGNVASETGGGHIEDIRTHSLEQSSSFEEVMSNGRGFGLAGWTYSGFKTAFRDYMAHVGGNWDDEEVQIGFLVETIKATSTGNANSWENRIWGNYPNEGFTYTGFTNATSPEQAATQFCGIYERPAAGCYVKDSNGNVIREREARKAYNLYSDKAKPVRTSGIAKTIGNGVLAWPSPTCTRINSRYGYRNKPTAGATNNHKGIDIACSNDSSVVASYTGTVVKVMDASNSKDCTIDGTFFKDGNGGRGYYVVLQHNINGNTIYTLYQHLSRILVKEGQTVSMGQEIARSGGVPGVAGSGATSGAHLHYEVHVNSMFAVVEPCSYLGLPSQCYGEVSGKFNQ